MDKEELRKENLYLTNTLDLLDDKINLINANKELLGKELIKNNSQYLAEMRYMNLTEISEETQVVLSGNQRLLENMQNEISESEKEMNYFIKMKDCPYFARIDFKSSDVNVLEKYYIGVHTLQNKENNEFIVLDWRSPIAGLYYDYDAGLSEIKSEGGITPCQLINKRQIQIANGKLDYFFDTEITIDDQILKQTLAKSASSKMKSIVQTIQKEQNSIIRRDNYTSLIVQGVAGSGKTAIAMHRIAYLLYKLHGKIKSENFAMITPNKAFASYISSVLPDLAEEDIQKLQLDDICKKALKKFAIVEYKYEQIERVLCNQNDYESFKYKTSKEFLDLLLNFCETSITNTFNCEELNISSININPRKINDLYYKTYAEQDIFTRICWICEEIINSTFYKLKNSKKLMSIRDEIITKLYANFKEKNCVRLYMKFLESLKMNIVLAGDKLKNEDCYPLLVLRSHIFGYQKFENIEHLVIDEVQDYSPCQLYIISKLFNCTKTMLGDFKQSIAVVKPENNIGIFKNIFKDKLEFVSLNTSYRPTKQIANLYNYIGNITDVNIIDRSGDEPEILNISENMSINILVNQINKLKQKYGSIAIITKTNRQAIDLHKKLSKRIEINLIDDNNDEYDNKTCIISVFNSKGLEFDAVIMYGVSEENYNSEKDRNLLYIGISRALHNITLVNTGQLNSVLKEYFNLRNE